MVLLSDICSFPEKITLSLPILNKSLPIVARYLQVLCRIIEYTANCTSFYLICCTRTPGSLENETVLMSGKIIWEKNKSAVRITCLGKTCQPMSTSWRRSKKEHLFARTSPSLYFWILRLFSLRTAGGRCAYLEDENEILQRDIEKTLIILYRNKNK